MALTTDGYETAVYKRPRDPQLGYTVLSPRDDVFLLNNSSNGRELAGRGRRRHEPPRDTRRQRAPPGRSPSLVRVRHCEGRRHHLVLPRRGHSHGIRMAGELERLRRSAVPSATSHGGLNPPAGPARGPARSRTTPATPARTTTRAVARSRPGGTSTAAGNAVRSPRTIWAPSVGLRRASWPTDPATRRRHGQAPHQSRPGVGLGGGTPGAPGVNWWIQMTRSPDGHCSPDPLSPPGGVAGRGIRWRLPTGSRKFRARDVRRWPVGAGRRRHANGSGTAAVSGRTGARRGPTSGVGGNRLGTGPTQQRTSP